MPGECYSIEEIQNFVSRDVNRIVGDIMYATARRAPWISVLDNGMFENQMGYSMRTVIQEPAVVASGLTVPETTLQRNVCRELGGTDRTGTREYTFEVGYIRNRSEEVCVTQAKTAFKRSYLAAADSLKKGIVKVKNADIRGQMLLLSGVKVNVVESYTYDQMINGTIGSLETDFQAVIPDSYISFQTVKKISNIMYDDFMAEPWDDEGQGVVAKWIGSRESVDRFREELDVRADLRAMITGRYPLGNKSIDGYSWDGPYQGISFGVDMQPLRAEFGGGGTEIIPGTGLELVEPEIAVNSTNGVGARPNPAWSAARWELGALVFARSFKRLAGQNWLGEGDAKWPHQLAVDMLQFKSIEDNDCNWFGDMGRFGYQISRAYEPQQPHDIAFFLYKRCRGDNNLAACDSNLNVL